MQVKVLSRKLVKPAVPTPEKLRTYKISCTDEVNPTMNAMVILYYPFIDNAVIRIEDLKNSLSRKLPQFHPLAGRYVKEHNIVDCRDDHGAEFVEAEVADYDLAQVMVGFKAEELNDLLPCDIGVADEVDDPILAIQVTRFRCGGMTLAASVSHRIADACTLGIFLSAWAQEAAPTLHEGEGTIHPDFSSPLYLPGENLPKLDVGVRRIRDGAVVTKRFVFDARVISSLRDRVSHLRKNMDQNARPYSRVLLVSAFLTEVLMRVDRRSRGGQARACHVAQAINIRERTTIPPLVPKHACGNLVTLAITNFSPNETKEKKFEDLVPILGVATKEGVAKCGEKLAKNYKAINNEFVAAMERCSGEAMNGLWFTDWSKFGFYDLDFGWGKPVWASLSNVPMDKLIILMNTKNSDGLEVWLNLDKEDMVYLEEDEQLKQLLFG